MLPKRRPDHVYGPHAGRRMSQAGFYFYTGDWVKDTRVLSLSTRGAWADALCFLNEHQGSVTWPVSAYANFWTISIDQATAILDELRLTGVANVEWQSDGKTIAKLSNRRMIREIQKRMETLEKRTEAGKKGAAARWQKCDSSSSESSSSLKKKEKERKSEQVKRPTYWDRPLGDPPLTEEELRQIRKLNGEETEE